MGGIELRLMSVLPHRTDSQGADRIGGFRRGQENKVLPLILTEFFSRSACLQVDRRANNLPRQQASFLGPAQVVHILQCLHGEVTGNEGEGVVQVILHLKPETVGQLQQIVVSFRIGGGD